MNEQFIHFLNGYLEGKLSKKDLKAFLRMIEESDEERSVLARSTIVHRLLKISHMPQVSAETIMQALPKNDDTADLIISQIAATMETKERPSESAKPKDKLSSTNPNKVAKSAAIPRMNLAHHISSHSPRSRRTPALVLVFRPLLAVAASFALLAGVWHFTTKSEPVVQPASATAYIEPRGDVDILRKGQLIQARTGTQLFSGDVMTTADNGQAIIRYYGEYSYIRMRSGSELTLTQNNNSKRLYLERGSISAGVSAQPEGAPMLISTPFAEVKVIGTHFRIASRQSQILLEVSEGNVLATRRSDGSKVEVKGGQQVLVDGSSSRLVAVSTGDAVIGHLNSSQMKDINSAIDTARSITINTLICDEKLLTSSESGRIRNAISAAHKADINFFVKFDLLAEDSSRLDMLRKRTSEIIKEYDCDGFYFAVEQRDASTSEMLRSLSSHIAVTQPGTRLMAGTLRGEAGSENTWHLGY